MLSKKSAKETRSRPNVTKLVIDRKRWLTGRVPFDDYGSRLLNPHTGKMCCLGFLALACGASTEQINGLYGPGEATQVSWPKHLLVGNELFRPKVLGALFSLNDSHAIDDATREAEITAAFSSIGIEVSFVSEYTEPAYTQIWASR